MKLSEKLDYLRTNYMGEWLKTRQEVEDDLSSKNSMFCFCGRIATGFHESSCQKFRNKVTSETVKKLKHLLPLLTKASTKTQSF